MSRRLTVDEIVNRLNKKYNYQYSYTFKTFDNVHDKLTLICKEHGSSDVIIWDHLNGSICKKCANKNRSIKQSIGTNLFIHKSKTRYNNLFNYDKTDYKNNRTKVEIKCVIHNIEFEQLPNQHLNGNISCPLCFKTKSIGENKIRDILNKLNLNYKEQYSFKSCRNIKLLKFDFYLTDYDTLIEYDGIQHYEKRWNSDKEFDRIKKNDLIKNEYCLQKNIKLKRIPYTELNNIEKIINKIINDIN